MGEMNEAKVLIDGKVYHLVGEESEEYMHLVAAYINRKMAEVEGLEAVKRMNSKTRSILTILNIADDYIKEKDERDRLYKQSQEVRLELDEVKSRLADLSRQNEALEAQLATWKEKYRELELQKAKIEARSDAAGGRYDNRRAGSGHGEEA